MASRVGLKYTSSDMLLAIRFTVSVIAMLILVVLGVFKLNLKDKPVGKLILMGLCQPIIYFIGETDGIRYTNSSFAGIMISLIPVVTAVLSAVFLHEKISGRTIGWILCSVAGVFIISTVQTSSGVVQFKGIVYLIVAVVSASVFYILSRSVADDYTPFERTFIMLMLGFVIFTAQAIIKEGADFLPLFRAGIMNKELMIPVLYLSIISSLAAFILQNYAVAHLELTKITVFENVIPVISVFAGVTLLGEPFSWIQLAGIALCLLGVWKVTTIQV